MYNLSCVLLPVEVELLYHSRGKWVALKIHFVAEEEDPKRISEQFWPQSRMSWRKQMENIFQQGMKGFKYMYGISCQTKKAVCTNKEFCVDLKSLPVIVAKIPKLYNSPNTRARAGQARALVGGALKRDRPKSESVVMSVCLSVLTSQSLLGQSHTQVPL